jgi:hypothetical protein
MSTTPQTTEPPAAEQSNGFATYLKVLYAPGEAFATLARVPTWGWAAIIGLALTLVGTIFLTPATTHYAHIAQEQRLSQMPADQAAAAREAMAKMPSWTYSLFSIIGSFFGPWIFWLVGALVFLIGAALGGGEARFKGAWVCAVNLYIIAAIGSVIGGIILALRGAASVNSASDLYALPSLAMLVHGSPKVAMFLYGFNVINIWFYVTAVIALEHVMKMGRGAAIATVVVFAVLAAGLGALAAR